MGQVINILVGSIRDDSHSLKIAHILAAQLAAAGHHPTVIDPRNVKLWIPHHPDEQGTTAIAQALQQQVQKSAGIIFVTPEYDGSYSAVSKILIEHLGYPSALSGKPISVIGVATGRVGAYRAIDHLRAVLMHIGAVVYPPILSFSEVHRQFAVDGSPDAKLEQMLSKHASEFMGFV